VDGLVGDQGMADNALVQPNPTALGRATQVDSAVPASREIAYALHPGKALLGRRKSVWNRDTLPKPETR
jgi:hypothetical protein